MTTTKTSRVSKMFKKINWVYAPFLISTPIIGLIGTAILCMHSMVTWPTWVLALAMYVFGGISITAGYHRLYSHKTYKASWIVELLLVLGGSATFQGSVLKWSTDHRDHHRYVDTDKDPYDINKGFWYAHIGWLLTMDESRLTYENVKDLKENKLLAFQHRYYSIISLVMGFGLPTLIASFWGEAWAGFFVAGALRTACIQHSTFFINSICHMFGKRAYSTKVSARDNWVTALATFGEGYHNYHHQFPLDYRNGIKAYHFDPSKWLIYGLSCVGLTSNLRRIPKHRIIQACVETHKNEVKSKSQNYLLEHLYEPIMQLIANIKEFEKKYAISPSIEYKLKIKDAKCELKNLFKDWRRAALAT